MRSCEKIVIAKHTKCNEATHFSLSLRGSGDSHNEAIQKNMDCHDFASQNLAMTIQLILSLRGDLSPKQTKQ